VFLSFWNKKFIFILVQLPTSRFTDFAFFFSVTARGECFHREAKKEEKMRPQQKSDLRRNDEIETKMNIDRQKRCFVCARYMTKRLTPRPLLRVGSTTKREKKNTNGENRPKISAQ